MYSRGMDGNCALQQERSNETKMTGVSRTRQNGKKTKEKGTPRKKLGP